MFIVLCISLIFNLVVSIVGINLIRKHRKYAASTEKCIKAHRKAICSLMLDVRNRRGEVTCIKKKYVEDKLVDMEPKEKG